MKYSKLTPQQRKARRYAQNYPYLEAKVDALADMRQAIRYDVDKVQTSPEDKMLERAIEMDVCTSAMRKIDHSLWIAFGVDMEPAKQVICYQRTRESVERDPHFWKMKYTQYRWDRMCKDFYSVLWMAIKPDEED